MCPSKTTQVYQANTLRYRPGGLQGASSNFSFCCGLRLLGSFFFFFNTSVIGICVGPPEQQGKIKCENKVKVHQIFIVTEEKTKKKLMREVGNGLKAKLL